MIEKIVIPLLLLAVNIIGLFILYAVFVWFPYSKHVEKQCLAHGYKNERVDIELNAYCYKRVNSTDVIIPLSEVGK